MLNGLAGELRKLADSIESGDIRVDRWEIERGCLPVADYGSGFTRPVTDGEIYVSLELRAPGDG